MRLRKHCAQIPAEFRIVDHLRDILVNHRIQRIVNLTGEDEIGKHHPGNCQEQQQIQEKQPVNNTRPQDMYAINDT